MNILQIFRTQEDLHWFLKLNVNHCVTLNVMAAQLESPTAVIAFKVIANMQDCMKIAGMEFGCVLWHYCPAKEVKRFVQSRIRSSRL